MASRTVNKLAMGYGSRYNVVGGVVQNSCSSEAVIRYVGGEDGDMYEWEVLEERRNADPVVVEHGESDDYERAYDAMSDKIDLDNFEVLETMEIEDDYPHG